MVSEFTTPAILVHRPFGSLDTIKAFPNCEYCLMQSERALKHFILALALALAGYVVFYTAIEHRRTRKGPWVVTFTTSPAGAPALWITQKHLGISNVTISFRTPVPVHDPVAATVGFSNAQAVPYNLPLGRCVFMDTTFLPGTVTMQLFGHEIELLPRVLVIDRKEHAWNSSSRIELKQPP